MFSSRLQRKETQNQPTGEAHVRQNDRKGDARSSTHDVMATIMLGVHAWGGELRPTYVRGIGKILEAKSHTAATLVSSSCSEFGTKASVHSMSGVHPVRTRKNKTPQSRQTLRELRQEGVTPQSSRPLLPGCRNRLGEAPS